MTSSTNTYPPGPADWRRSLIEIQRSPTEFLLDLQHTYGNFVHYRHGPAHCYLINDPDLIRQILVDDADQMMRPPATGRSIGKFLGHGLLTTSGKYHHQQRKVIQPIFTPTWVESYAETMRQSVSDLTATWRDGDARDLVTEMADLTMNIIYRTIFGISPDALQNTVRSAIDTLQQYSGEMMRRTPQVSEADCQLAIAQLDAAVEELVAHHQQSGNQGDLLSRLLDTKTADGHPMTSQQIRDEAVTFFVAGQETSANALAWLFYLLATHPDQEAKVRESFGSSSPLENAYAEWTILEALRLYPPAWLIGRTPIETYTIRGYPIQPGDSLVISPYVLHRTSDFYAQPDIFWPERFQDALPRYSFLPFGAGPHVCIGQPFAMQEIRIALEMILANWRYELTSDAPIEPEPLITLQPRGEISVVLHKIGAS